MKMRLWVVLCSLCVAAVCAAAPVNFEGPSKARLYGRADFSVTVEEVSAQPWLQEVDMRLTSPSGKELLLPCFWVEGNRFAARFTPQEKGAYRFRFAVDGGAISDEGSLKVSGSRAHGMIHPNGNWTFVCDDGTLFRGVGENICWESRTHDDSKFFSALHEQHDRFNYDAMLPAFAAAGGNFVRVWMCSWNFPIDRQRDFNNFRYEDSDAYFNPSATARLDHVVELADQLGIKLMLCMGPGNVRADERFFTSEEAKARYRTYLRYIVARWGYSPAIGLWEFFNEVDNIQFSNASHPIPAEVIVAWHREMAAYLKTIDPFRHPVTTSISHRDLKGLNDIEDIDLNQKHIYCATGAIPGTIAAYEAAHGKPYVIGEFSYEWDWSKNFDDFAADMDRDFKRGLWYGLMNPTPITPMSWWWEYFDERGLVPYFRSVRYISDRMLRYGKGAFERVPVDCPADAYAVRCGKRAYLYVYNNTEKTLTELPLRGRWVQALDFAAARLRPFSGSLSLAPGEEALFEIH